MNLSTISIELEDIEDTDYECTPDDLLIQELWDDVFDYMDNIKPYQSDINILMEDLYKLIQRFKATNIIDYRQTYIVMLDKKYQDLKIYLESADLNGKQNLYTEIEKVATFLANCIVG